MLPTFLKTLLSKRHLPTKFRFLLAILCILGLPSLFNISVSQQQQQIFLKPSNSPRDATVTKLVQIISENKLERNSTVDKHATNKVYSNDNATAQQNQTKRIFMSDEEYQKLPPCPNHPPNLVGAINVSLEEHSWQEMDIRHPELSPGGRWRPSHCQALHQVAVIIPYRGRDVHLRILLNNLHTYLQKQQLDYGVYVAEQDFNATFNRGMMRNIGAKFVIETDKMNCLIFHDVDLLPEHDHNMYTCTSTPKHISVAVDKHNYKTPYSNHFGGVVSITAEHMKKVNGYSNAYFGWGSEDDDMATRVQLSKLKVLQGDIKVGRYKMIKHEKDEPNGDRWKYVKTRHFRMRNEGYNTLNYTLLAVERRKLFTRIYVNVDEKVVMSNIPLPKNWEKLMGITPAKTIAAKYIDSNKKNG